MGVQPWSPSGQCVRSCPIIMCAGMNMSRGQCLVCLYICHHVCCKLSHQHAWHTNVAAVHFHVHSVFYTSIIVWDMKWTWQCVLCTIVACLMPNRCICVSCNSLCRHLMPLPRPILPVRTCLDYYIEKFDKKRKNIFHAIRDDMVTGRKCRSQIQMSL